MTQTLNYDINQAEDTTIVIQAFDDDGPLDLTYAAWVRFVAAHPYTLELVLNYSIGNHLTVSGNTITIDITAADTAAIAIDASRVSCEYQCDAAVYDDSGVLTEYRVQQGWLVISQSIISGPPDSGGLNVDGPVILNGLLNCNDDPDAAAKGVPVNALYHTSGAVRIRLT